MLILSGAGVLAVNVETDVTDSQIFSNVTLGQTLEINKKITCSQLVLNDKNSEYITMKTTDDSGSYITDPGRPKLPVIVEKMELPFEAKNIKIEVTPNNLNEFLVEKEIKPVSPMLPLTYHENPVVKTKKDTTIYSNNKPYPSNWYKYTVRSGLNTENKVVKHVSIHLFPARYTPVSNKIDQAQSFDIKITYDQPKEKTETKAEEYDMVIIAPSYFCDQLERLEAHKNSVGVDTFIKTTEQIYEQYYEEDRDKPEQIKYFLKDAFDENGIKYVLLVGGLNSRIWAKPRDYHSAGSRYWHVPVRYTNLFDNPEHPLESEDVLHDPGVISDLYYADLYDGENNFSSWDPNDDGVYAAWGRPGVEENDTGIDLLPELSVGRLACRNKQEVKTVVDKIINYETTTYGQEWFNKMIVISGDGFLDQEDLDFQWNITDLENGQYFIYGQSVNKDGIAGPIDEIKVKIDKNVESSISFNHDDHLQVDGYPARPITEITSPSNGDVLGNDDFFYEPTEGEAYDNEFSGWANVSYENYTMHIRGKSYDPRPYGNVSGIL